MANVNGLHGRTSLAGMVGACAILGLLAITGCTGPAEGTAATQSPTTSSNAGPETAPSRLDSVLAAGTLKVCSTGDYKPFSYLDPETKDWSGIDIDMVEDLAKHMEVKVEYVQTKWADLMPDFLSKCDIGVGGISISMARAKQAFYSIPTMRDGKTPITRCENVEKYDTIGEINQPGVRSITPVGGTNEKFAAANYPAGQIIRHENNNTIFEEILAGRADVMTTDAPEAMWVSHQHPELCAVNPEKPFSNSQMGYLLPRGDEVFQEYVDQWLNIAMNDGTLAAARQPWFG